MQSRNLSSNSIFMKKLLYSVLAILLLSLACIYIFIPNQIVVSRAEHVESSERIVAKYLNISKNRREWWPGKTGDMRAADSSVLAYEDYHFNFKNPHYRFSEVLISNGDFKTSSLITWEVYPENTIKIGWRTSIPASNNPVKRFLQYQQARKVKATMVLIMEHLLNYIVSSEKVYGLDIDRKTVQDTILATSIRVSVSYPQTSQVYNLIGSVKKYVEKQGARQVSPAMLNVFKNEQGHYRMMVALPVDKEFKPDSNVLINRMVAGNILVAEIKGGPQAILNGFNQMNTYMKDFKLISPAMPFESLITDRSLEKDTSRWVTKIYYPIL